MTTPNDASVERQNEVWQTSNIMWGAFLLCAVLMGLIFYAGLDIMVTWWFTREEYGHGFMIPFITAFLIWQKKDKLETVLFTGSWSGLVIVSCGVLLYFLGELASVYIVIQYAFLITLLGTTLSFMGYKAFRIILAPLFILFFMLPLPNFLFNDLSAQLQLISSELGVAVIRLFDISVYLEGNVIDLGTYKLQVVEACSGLNYLFPLMTLGFIAAYFFNGSFWKKAVIFLSTIPITILMNSFRIGLIGVTVEYWGTSMAEGILHDFQGWVIFMSCTTILICEMWVLAHIGKNKLPLREAFGIDFPLPTPESATIISRKLNKSFISVAILLVITLLASFLLENRSEVIPDRKVYAEFPLEVGDWVGNTQVLEYIYVDKLKLTDYSLIDYRSNDQFTINFYSAYYESQRKESTTHSPRSCIPGGGWLIKSTKNIVIEDAIAPSVPLNVNRLVIEKNEVSQLVYYWFKQRDRYITNEQMIKWFFFVDSIQRQRTDGALLRLTTVVPKGGSIEEADARLAEFVKNIAPIIPEYVPD